MNTIEDFLTQDDTDMSVAMLAMVRNKYCFVIQPPKRWSKTADGRDILFFGGIGGKLEEAENLMTALHRESKEEIGCDIEPIYKKGDFQTVYIPPESEDMTKISYYHMGMVFFSKVAAGLPGAKEPEKNKLFIVKGNCGLNLLLNQNNIDKWLIKAICTFIPPTKEE